jgi:3-oxoacyl-[acyl-carrier protein] reductase
MITGGTRGIGKGIAVELARLGYDVVLSYSADESRAKETKQEIETLAVACEAVRADVSEAAD